jgi:hypothetical protein
MARCKATDMDTVFYIDLNIKKGTDFVSYGRFYIGNSSRVAKRVFDSMQGTTDAPEESVIRLDLVEVVKGVPQTIRMMSCTLEQVAENCKAITKETFKRFSLGF